MTSKIQIEAGFDFSKFGAAAQKAIQDAFNQPINARVNLVGPSGQPLSQAVSGIAGGGGAGVPGVPGGMGGGGNRSSMDLPTASLADLKKVSKDLGTTIEGLNQQLLNTIGLLSKQNDEQKKETIEQIDHLKALKQSKQALKDLTDSFLGGDSKGGFGGVKGAGMAVAALASLFALPGIALGGAAAKGQMAALGTQALGSTDVLSMMRTDPQYMERARTLSLFNTISKEMGIAGAAGIAGFMVGGPWGAAAGLGGSGLTGLAGRWQQSYYSGQNTALQQMRMAGGMTLEQADIARNFVMGPQLNVQGALWGGRRSEAGIRGMFDPSRGAAFEGRNPEDIANALMSMIYGGGRGFAQSGAAQSKINSMAYAMNLDASGAANLLVRGRGISGVGGTAGTDLDRLESMYKRAVKEGVSEAPTLLKLVDTTISMATTGTGMTGTDMYYRLMMAANAQYGTSGDTAARAAQTTAQMLESLFGARSGMAGQITWRGVSGFISGIKGQLRPGANLATLEAKLAGSSQAQVESMLQEGMLDEYFTHPERIRGNAKFYARQFAKSRRSAEEDILRPMFGDTALGMLYGEGVDNSYLNVRRMFNTSGAAMRGTHPRGAGLMTGDYDPTQGARGATGREVLTQEAVGNFTNFVMGVDSFLDMLGKRKENIDGLGKLTSILADLLNLVPGGGATREARRAVSDKMNQIGMLPSTNVKQTGVGAGDLLMSVSPVLGAINVINTMRKQAIGQ